MPVQSERRDTAAGAVNPILNSKIEEVRVSPYTIPTDFPESDGTIAWDKTTIVVVEITCDGIRGLGYTYADVSTAHLIRGKLGDEIVGKNAMDIGRSHHAMLVAIRNLGRPGIVSMAISAVDVALWDLKARLLAIPLFRLLGAVREEIPIYGSGGFTSYSIEQLQSQLGGWVRSGISMVKMKIGHHPENDVARVRAARETIGPETQLFVDANGAYSRKQALSFAESFREFGVSWFEEPVSSDDLAGLHLIRDRAPAGMDIAAGEYAYDSFYFRRMLESASVDVLQADATRCGGVSGFVHAGSMCLARCLPLSAHTAPSIHAHLGCAVQQVRHLEYFHDHVRIEHMCFDGVLEPVNGRLRPDPEQPGLGLTLRREQVQKYAAS